MVVAQTDENINMKKACLITFLLFINASIASAEDVGQALSESASGEVIQSTRQLIQSGLNSDSAIDVTRAMLKNKFTDSSGNGGNGIVLWPHSIS